MTRSIAGVSCMAAAVFQCCCCPLKFKLGPQQLSVQVDTVRLTAVPYPQVPIGLEEFHEGAVDLIHRKAYTFGGAKGLDVVEGQVPADLQDQVEEKRAELIERVSEVNTQASEGGGAQV